jgi:hypothetical protein
MNRLKRALRVWILSIVMLTPVVWAQSVQLGRPTLQSGSGNASGSAYQVRYTIGSSTLGGMKGPGFKLGLATHVDRIQEDLPLPTSFYFSQNYPNPFNQSTRFNYQLPARSQVTIQVYSVLGKRVATLFRGTQPAGHYRVRFDGRDDRGIDLSTGVYFCQFQTETYSRSVRFLIVR